MKRLCLQFSCILLLVGVVGWGYAYTVDEIFVNFKHAYEQSRNFSANFEETTFRDDLKSASRGRLVFSKPNLLRKEYVGRNNPNEMVQLIVLDGEYSWSYTPILEQVNRMKWNNANRKELIPGIGASLDGVEENYTLKLIPDDVANKKGIYQIELTPKPHLLPATTDGALRPREILSVWVKSDNWLPVQFGYKSESESGDSVNVIVSMTNIQRDQELDPTLFTFTLPKGVEVIDISTDDE